MPAAEHHPPTRDVDIPISADEIARFADLQVQFAGSFSAIFEDPALPRTVLIVATVALRPA